jgi:L-fuculose-phosphate aldolase
MCRRGVLSPLVAIGSSAARSAATWTMWRRRPMTGAAETHQRRLRLQLVSAGAALASSGVILSGEGNLSARLDGDHCLITPAGLDKGRLDARDMVVVPIDWGRIPRQASSESKLHISIYQRFSAIQAVVHAHPPQVQGLDRTDRVPDCRLLTEGQQLLGRVAWVQSLDPGSDALAYEVAAALQQAPACILDRHGAVTVGSTVEEALRRMLLLERLAKLTAAAILR